MPLPCNNVRVTPIKVSQLVRYSNLDGGDILLTVESGSLLWSRRSTVNDLKVSMGKLTGSYSGSFTGSFVGVSSGSFSGSYWGKITSKNVKATGSFSGSHWGSLISKNTKATGSFSGSYWGDIVSKNIKATGSFSGSYWGDIVSKNIKATGSFNGANNKLSGSFSGSYWGSINSKNAKATGSFSGTNNKLSGSFSGSYFGKVVSKNSLLTGSFRGIDNITNFKNTGKKVSFNGTSSYAVSSSYAQTASLITSGIGGFPVSLYKEQLSTNTVAFFIGGGNEGVGTFNFAITHGFGTSPSLVRATLYCNSNDLGYVTGDEVGVEVAEDDTGGADDERNIFAVWTNSTYAGVSIGEYSAGVYISRKTGGTRSPINQNSWKLKIRVWK
jgi:hypothetical protein